MTTRSGASYRRMEDQRIHAEDVPAGSQRTTGGALPEIASLTEMVRVMIQDRERREREIAEERARRDEEREEERARREREREDEQRRSDRQREESKLRIAKMRRQMERLQDLFAEQSAATVSARSRSTTEPIKLTKLTDEDNIESYLTTFERIMAANEVNKERWSFQLAPHLTGKAQQAYAALPTDEAKNYDTLKEAILRRYDINEETYRQQFRKLRPKEGEPPQELITRVKDLATRWARESKTRDELLDLMVREQFLSILPEDARVAVIKRQPKDSEEAGRVAATYLQAHSMTINRRGKKTTTPVNECPRCGKHGHWAKDCPRPRENSSTTRQATSEQRQASRPFSKDTSTVRCYNCNERGHYASSCPRRSMYCGQPEGEADRARRRGIINGTYCADILVDTGATQTLVHRRLVTEDNILDGEVTIRCAHGDTSSYPLAAVKINIGGKDIITTAGVSNTLPASALLGWDVPELLNLVEGHDTKNTANALAVVTRQRRKQQEAQERQSECEEMTASTQPTELLPAVIDQDSDQVFNFDESFFPPAGPPKPTLTRAQKQADRHLYRHADVSPEELRKLQHDDDSLCQQREIAEGASSAAAGENFFYRDGLLYRQYSPPGVNNSAHDIEQLVVPAQLRPPILRLAHNIPMAGHLVKKKTADRILARFYWPGVYRDVEEHCQTCSPCQKSSTRRVKKAPLVPLPIMDEPFRRIAMDIVGPLPRSNSGKRYILVICDYATRYPEAIALRSIDVNAIAGELLSFFARVGVPEEILTDQGTNFTSQLLAEVYRLLKIKPIRTTPYHPQTDGLVERFNGTLKAMLKKTVAEEGKDWDRLLPYLLFAYREVPQASTGFSPFELVYGRNVRGPLDVLKEAWAANTRSSESVVSYVLMMQERLEKLREIVRENLEDAQATQKEWYDRNARNREFQPGDQVLILLPTTSNKLLAEWRGPYPVVRKVSNVTYEVKVTDSHKKNRIFHVNMLRGWKSPTAALFVAQEVSETEEEDDGVVLWDGSRNEAEQPNVNPILPPQQHSELEEILRQFSDVLSSRPGRTNVAECRIRVGAAAPIRLPPYRLPHAYRDIVKGELEEMEKDGIIECSTSEWAFPIVLVKKKDSSLRMCVDYRRLNTVSEADAYPMPRVDDMIDALGKAKFITTLDLARGYWQVPVQEDSRPLTAFTTPYGLFQFRVMPFGLQGAPATFQRMMDQLLVNCTGYAAAYLDDVIIYSTT